MLPCLQRAGELGACCGVFSLLSASLLSCLFLVFLSCPFFPLLTSSSWGSCTAGAALAGAGAWELTALRALLLPSLGLGALWRHVLWNKGCVPFLSLMVVFYGMGQAQIPLEAAAQVSLCRGQPQSHAAQREAVPKPLLME